MEAATADLASLIEAHDALIAAGLETNQVALDLADRIEFLESIPAEPAKHNHGPNFGRKVDGCPRCEQLKNGAEPKTWAKSTKDHDAELTREIRNHDCKRSNCGPVCTAFQW